ncbi:hypothetical protein CP532_0833 [Ophiocordyceps camponoti-leonardi (nom. inval.)]|nr:hypothetical protein CP532_0833 [Ophiocordyceps camponoti-leonardi (nom. inval.)]
MDPQQLRPVGQEAGAITNASAKDKVKQNTQAEARDKSQFQASPFIVPASSYYYNFNEDDQDHHHHHHHHHHRNHGLTPSSGRRPSSSTLSWSSSSSQSRTTLLPGPAHVNAGRDFVHDNDQDFYAQSYLNPSPYPPHCSSSPHSLAVWPPLSSSPPREQQQQPRTSLLPPLRLPSPESDIETLGASSEGVYHTKKASASNFACWGGEDDDDDDRFSICLPTVPLRWYKEQKRAMAASSSSAIPTTTTTTTIPTPITPRNKRRRSNKAYYTDSIDALDSSTPEGHHYHHAGPYEAALPIRNLNPRLSPLAATHASNVEALRATPRQNVLDSLRLHKPIHGVASVPSGGVDGQGNRMEYEEGADIMRDSDAAGGPYKRWPGLDYHPDDLKGKGEPAYTTTMARSKKRLSMPVLPSSSSPFTTVTSPPALLTSPEEEEEESNETAAHREGHRHRRSLSRVRLTDGIIRRIGSVRRHCRKKATTTEVVDGQL